MTNEEFIKSIRLQGEEWRDVVGWEDFYMVSSFGRIMSKSKVVRCGNGTRTLKPQLKRIKVRDNGYCEVGLTNLDNRKFALVHRLVAEAFIQNPQNKPLIDHLDRNRQNNNISNLRWCTMSENMLNPMTRNFRRDMYIGIERPCIYKPVVAIKDGVVVKQYESIKSATKDGFTGCCISNCCSGRDKTHKGYSWMYLSDYENSCHQ